MENLVKEFGLQVGLIIILLSFCGFWIRWVMKRVEEATQERKSITEKHEDFMANHIHENTQTMASLFQSIKEFRSEIAQSFKDNNRDHRDIMEKLK